MQSKLPRPKKCKVCKIKFQPERFFQSCHSPECAAIKAIADRRKKEKKELAARRQDAMRMGKRQARARRAAQDYARTRDIKCFEKNGEIPVCIMCGSSNPKSWHGCHFVSVGSRGGPRALHPANINLGCSKCNLFSAQNDTKYRYNMIVKYGLEMVEYLETASFDYKMTADEVDEIWKYYKSLLKELKCN